MATFTLDLSKWADKAKGKVATVVKATALELDRRIIARSPVDTGRFRANWQVGLGSAPSGDLPDAYDKSGANTLAKGSKTVATIKGGQKIPVVWLVNNLPYAKALEDGHSKQASSGVVKVTVAEFGSIVNSNAADAK